MVDVCKGNIINEVSVTFNQPDLCFCHTFIVCYLINIYSEAFQTLTLDNAPIQNKKKPVSLYSFNMLKLSTFWRLFE